LTLAALFLFIMVNVNPIMVLNIEGQPQAATLFSGAQELHRQGMWLLALVVLVTSIVVPLAQISGMLYVLLPLNLSFKAPKAAAVFRWVRLLQPWGMMEVFLLGILISIVKLAEMADIMPGVALYSLGVLIFITAAAATSLDPHQIWEKMGEKG
jgi:paraquat-inducible protein A